MRFEWDPDKASRNERVHGVSFEEAKELFTTDGLVLEVYDVEHSVYEDRYKSIGPIRRGLVLVVWAERDEDTVRIISAWLATKVEQQLYQEFLATTDG